MPDLEPLTVAASPANTTSETYHLSDKQIAFFDANGYLILHNWITGELLSRLQEAGNTWIEQGLASDQSNPDHSDFVFARRSSGQLLFRVNYLHNKGQAASLELLGSPQVLGVAESLCGPNFVPTYESMVFKQKGDGEAIKWHQDAVHPRRHRIFNFDLYLDPSISGAGALRVVPGSQEHKQDVCKVADDWKWNPPGMIEVELQAGDVLIHDVMLVHGSPHVEGHALRRTIYYEFRAAEEILEDGPWDKNWIERRLRLVPLGLERYKKAFSQEPQFRWQVSEQFRPEISQDEQQELKIAHLTGMPGSYCSAGDAGKDISLLG